MSGSQVRLSPEKVVSTAVALASSIGPTHLITANLAGGRFIQNEAGSISRIPGDDIRYDRVGNDIVRSLTYSLYPRSSRKRHRLLLPAIIAIEGGDGWTSPHLHIAIGKPGWVDELVFLIHAEDSVRGNPWVLKGDQTVDIKALASVPDQQRAIAYTLKAGLGRVSITGRSGRDVTSH